MASPAAVLSVLVQSKGIQQTNKQLGGLQTQSMKTARTTDAMARRHTTAFSSIAKKAVGMGAATVGAYASIAGARKAIGATEELAKTTLMLSKNFGLTTKKASEWAAVATARGIDGKQLTMGFKGLSTAIRGAASGSKAQTKAFDELGISQKTLKEHGNDLNFMLAQVSDGLKKLPAGTNRSAIQAKLFGRTWQTLSPLLRDGSGELNTQLKTADKYGATFSNKGAKGLEDMIKAQRESKLATLGLQVAFGTQLAPALTKVITGMASFVSGLRDGTGAGGVVHDVFVRLFGVIQGGVQTVMAIVGWFTQHKTVTLALAAAAGVLFAAYAGFTVFYLVQAAVIALRTAMLLLNASFLTNPVFLVVAALAALAAGVVIAYRESDTFRKIVNTAWGVIKDVAGWLVTAGGPAFHWLAGAVKTAWGVIQTVTTTVWGALGPYLKGIFDVLKTLVKTYFLVYKTIIVGVWNAIQTVTTTVWGAIKTIATTAWGAIKTVATTAWDAIKTVILTPIRAVRDALGGKDGIWAKIHDTAVAAWDRIKGAVGDFASGVKTAVLDAIKGGLNKLIGFVNAVIGVINSIPGVPNIKKIGKLAQGGKVSKAGVQALAEGGVVNRPIVMMGEEAPRHPEYVIPTNPAYRGRARMLLGQAAGALGLATGGVFSSTSYGPPWGGIQGGGVTATGVNLKGSPHIFGVAVDPSVIALGQMLSIKPNPFGTTSKFKAFDTGGAIKDRRLDFYDWRGRAAQNAWGARDVLVSGIADLGQGGGGSVGDLLAALNPLDLIKKLPGLGNLPDWLKGTGSWLLGHVKDYITSTVSGLGGGIGDSGEKFAKMIAFAGRLDNMNIPYGAQGHSGWAINTLGEDCSSTVSKVLHAAGYLSNVLTTVGLPGALERGPGKMVTVHDRALAGNSGHTIIQLGNRFFGTSGQNPGGGPGFFSNPGAGYLGTLPTKLHPKGMAEGGILGQGAPFVGTYARGGTLPADGLYYGHRGETVVPRGAGGPLVHVEHMTVGSRTDENAWLARLGFKLATA